VVVDREQAATSADSNSFSHAPLYLVQRHTVVQHLKEPALLLYIIMKQPKTTTTAAVAATTARVWTAAARRRQAGRRRLSLHCNGVLGVVVVSSLLGGGSTFGLFQVQAWTITTTTTTTSALCRSIPSRRRRRGAGGAPFRLVFSHTNDDERSDDDDSNVPEWNDFADDAPLSSSSSFVQPIPIVYNDFGTNLIGDDMEVVVTTTASSSSTSSSSSPSVSLSERMSVVQDRQVRQTAIDARNWKLGNWQVRGVSFEDHNNSSSAVAATMMITRIVQTNNAESSTRSGAVVGIGDETEETDLSHDDDGPPLVWVGRSDGSIWAVRLGTEYWTKLGLAASDDDGLPQPESSWSSSSSSATTLVPWSESDDEEEDDDDDDEFMAAAAASPKLLRPSRVVARLVRNNDTSKQQQPIVALVAVPVHDDDDDETTTRVFATRAHPSNVIDAWHATIREADHSNDHDNDNDNDQAFISHTQTLVGGHDDGQSIVALQAVTVPGFKLSSGGGGDQYLLVSMDRSGGVALWNAATGSLQSRFSISDSDTGNDSNDRMSSPTTSTLTACSLWVTASHILVGTSTGQVLAYAITELLKNSNNNDVTVPTQPVVVAGRWRASEHAVTAMSGGGPGVMGNSGSGQSRTTVLFTGDAQGLVKRWELLTGTGSSTRLDAWPKLASQRLPKRAHMFSGHDDGVTALRAIDGTKFVSAGLDGTGTYTRGLLC
jgi:hypothetical protein